MSSSRPCLRFTRAGARCGRPTDFADGWCRECDGFVRAAPGGPVSAAGAAGTPKQVAATGRRDTGLDLDELADVRVTQAARDSFRFHHGGSDPDASVQIRSMLEDFLVRSSRTAVAGRYLQLARDGYVLVLSPDRLAVVEYRTVHRERTWAQLRSGVPSRFGAAAGQVRPPKPPPPPPAEDFSCFDAATVRLTKTALAAWPVGPDLRTHLASLPEPVRRADGVFVLTDGTHDFWVSPDASTLMRVQPTPPVF